MLRHRPSGCIGFTDETQIRSRVNSNQYTLWFVIMQEADTRGHKHISQQPSHYHPLLNIFYSIPYVWDIWCDRSHDTISTNPPTLLLPASKTEIHHRGAEADGTQDAAERGARSVHKWNGAHVALAAHNRAHSEAMKRVSVVKRSVREQSSNRVISTQSSTGLTNICSSMAKQS